jgi:DNA-binding NarL/FixJ family response regulator
MPSIRVVLADDHALVRAGIRALLHSLEGVQVVGEAGDGSEALSLIGFHQPDVVLMDIGMEGLNGLDATAQLTRQLPNVRVIILSMHANEEYVVQAIRAGAAGYLLKDSAMAELEIAVRAVARGETYLSPPVSKHVLADYVKRVSGEPAAVSDDRSHPLTPRQREILQRIAEGQTTQAIAHELGISVKTVETHRSQLMDRLQIHDLAGLVRYAIRTGLVRSDY